MHTDAQECTKMRMGKNPTTFGKKPHSIHAEPEPAAKKNKKEDKRAEAPAEAAAASKAPKAAAKAAKEAAMAPKRSSSRKRGVVDGVLFFNESGVVF